MKQIYLLLSFTLLFLFSNGQIYTTTSDGNWADASTWVGPIAPPPGFTEANVMHNVDIDVSVINTGGIINVSSGNTLNVKSGGNLFCIAGSNAVITGTLALSGTGIITMAGGTMNINGTFDYTLNGGTLPSGFTWGPSSALKYSGITNTFPTTQLDSYNDLEISSSGLESNLELPTADVSKFQSINITNTGIYAITSDAGDLTTISGNLTVGSSADFILLSNSKLSVNGTVSSAGTNNFVIESNAGGTGSLITPSSPNITMKCYVPSGSWHLIGPSTATAPATTFLSGYMQRWTEFDGGTGEGYWTAQEGNPTLTRGHGDAFYFIGDAFTASFAGIIPGTVLTVNGLTNSSAHTGAAQDGWHCLANPFPSGLNWSACTKANISSTALVYNGDSYVSRTTIPANEGFFVQVNVGETGSVTFPTIAKVHSVEGLDKSTDETTYSLKLNLIDHNSTSNDEIVLQLNDEATFDYDPEFDAHKIDGNEDAGEFYAHITDGEHACVIGVPYLNDPITIPVGFKKGNESSYTINVLEENFPSNLGIILEDTETNQFINLKTTPSYTFDAQETDTHRFNLLISDATGIEEQESIDARIWNANEKIYIQSYEKKAYSIFVYSITGSLVYSAESNNSETMSFSLDAPRGTYIVKYISGNSSFSQKIIK